MGSVQDSCTDLCMEDGEGLCCVQRDENPHQELLVFSLERQSEAINDAGEEKKTVSIW